MRTELFNFTIKIGTDNDNFWTLKEHLNMSLRQELIEMEILKNDDTDNKKIPNYFTEYLKYAVKKSFNNEEFSVFVTDYEEKAGSLVLTFGLLIFQRFLDYGSIRQSIDYFVDDTKAILNKVTKKDTIINYKKNTQQLPQANIVDNQAIQSSNNQIFDNYNLTNRIILILLTVLTTLILGFEISAKFIK